MNLTEENIIDVIESYRTKLDLGNNEMAKLCGMANGSVYYKWVNKKTTGGKIRYMLEFLKNTSKSIEYIFPNRNYYKLPEDTLKKADENVEIYSCPECRPRVIRIAQQEEEIKKLKDEALELHRKLNSILTENCKKETQDESGVSGAEDTKRNKAV